jgi:hypothetical protein
MGALLMWGCLVEPPRLLLPLFIALVPFAASAFLLTEHLVQAASVQITPETDECPVLDFGRGNSSTPIDTGKCSIESPIGEAQQASVKQLSETGDCPNCSLWDVNVTKVLRDANQDSRGIDLQNANLTDAKMCGLPLREAHLDEAILIDAILIKTRLPSAHLSRAKLTGAHLEWAELIKTDLTGAKMRDVHLDYARFETALLPGADDMSNLHGLKSTCWIGERNGLLALREAFKKARMQKEEREVAYALARSDRLHEESAWRRILPYLLFEMTTEWGTAPFRPIWIILALIPGFAIVYGAAIAWPSPSFAIWRVWDPNRVDRSFGRDEPERLMDRSYRMCGYAMAFSAFSALAFGWKGVSISTWIERLVPHEFTLRATGWARFAASTQALLSFLFLALASGQFFQ